MVAQKSSFKSMKENPKTNLWGPKNEMHKDNTCFIRKGVVGGWKNHFTPEQSARFEALCHEKFKPVGLEFDKFYLHF